MAPSQTKFVQRTADLALPTCRRLPITLVLPTMARSSRFARGACGFAATASGLFRRQNARAILAAPMNRLLTTLLVWLLMAALPLHAVAATMELSCAHSQQRHAAAAHPHADHAAADVDEHAHHGGHGEHAAKAAAADNAAGSGSGSMLSHASCSACSAFCVGAVAPPSASLPLPSFDGSDVVVIAPADFGTGFIPDGLQRPPRR